MVEMMDIKTMEQIIRVCQARGAFKAEEMSTIGLLYNKLVKIIEDNKVKEELTSILKLTN
jgi:hypothetical protein